MANGSGWICVTPSAAATLNGVTWNLSDLLKGDSVGSAESDEDAVTALLDRADRLAEEFAGAHEGRVNELDGPGLIEAMNRLAGVLREARGSSRELRAAALCRRHRGPRQRRPRPDGGRARHGDSDQAALLRVRVGRGRRQRGAAGDGRPGLAAANGYFRTSGAIGHVLLKQGRRRRPVLECDRRRVDPAVRAARLGDPPSICGMQAIPSRSTSRWRGWPIPTVRRVAPPRGGDGRSRAGAPHTHLCLQHPASGQVDQGPPALLSALARLTEPLQRGVRRVGAGAGRGGTGPLRAGPALVRDQGETARHRSAGGLRSYGDGHQRRRGGSLGGGPRPGPRFLRLLLRPGGGCRRALLRGPLDRRSADVGEEGRRLQCLDGPLGPPIRAAQLHRQAPRRDDARPRARPRAAPRPSPAEQGRLPPEHAADRRRDGIRVRRGGSSFGRLLQQSETAGVTPEPAGGGRSRDQIATVFPSDRDEPVRGIASTPPAGPTASSPVERFAELWAGDPNRAAR